MITTKKPKLLIFEGIATTGKTTTITNLLAYLQKNEGVTFVSEEKTFIPIFENKELTNAIEYLNIVVKKISEISTDYVVVERLFITHAFRTSSSLKEFHNFEKQLLDFFDPIIILLTMKDGCIANRIELADKQRGVSWQHKRAGTIEERVMYYSKQQNYLNKLSKESLLPVLSIDTSDMNWVRVLEEVKIKIS